MTKSSPQVIGKRMAIIAWLAGIFVLTQLFGNWETNQRQPNKHPVSNLINDEIHVQLLQNRQGHYRVDGKINGSEAAFMIDTGATDVVIPKQLANQFQLTGEGKGIGLTANGYVDLERTVIKELSIGQITLYNVRASINPGMTKDQAILLGMSALSQLELKQHQGILTLVQHN
jgi:aspartyl protease family protein